MARVMVVGGVAGSLVRFRGQLLQEMVGLGHEVIACAPMAPPEIRRQLASLGVRYANFPLQRTGINPLHDLQSLWNFIFLFRSIRPDVVLSYTIKPVIYGSIGATIAGITKISSMITGLGYAFSEETLRQRIIGSIARALYRVGLCRNQVVFFQNPDDLGVFRALGIVGERHQPTLINGSGIDLEQFDVRPLPREVSFLLIARLIAEKGIREYVEAARHLYARYPSVRFNLVGFIDSNPTAISKEDLDAWVREGFLNYWGRLEDVRPAIAVSSVYVLPSFYREGVPRSVLEALSMGRAIITTDAPGCRETVIDGVNGYLVPVRNVPTLIEAMEKFIVNPDLARSMGAASRHLAEQKFDVRQVNRVILQKLELLDEATV